jgi:universal stress protein A
MDVYRHLLAALDLSPETGQVVQRAAALSRACGARLSLAHVVEYIPMAYSGDLVLPAEFDLEQELLTVARQRLDAVAGQLEIPPADRHLVLGATAPEILRIVTEQAVDLVVVGSHRRHGLSLLLGSTAAAILHHAGCDMLAVRIRPERADAAPAG